MAYDFFMLPQDKSKQVAYLLVYKLKDGSLICGLKVYTKKGYVKSRIKLNKGNHRLIVSEENTNRYVTRDEIEEVRVVNIINGSVVWSGKPEDYHKDAF